MRDSLRLVPAEWTKLGCSRLFPVVLAATAVLAVGLVAAKLVFTGQEDLQGEEALRELLAIGGATGGVLSLVLGVLAMAGEDRHGMTDRTAVAVPQRWPAVVAKLLVLALAGAAVGLVAVVATFAVAVPWMEAEDSGFALTGGVARRAALGSIAACALLSAAGVALGALVRGELLALAVGLAWLVILDGIVGAWQQEPARFLPGGGVAALLRQPHDELLPMGLGALVLAGHVALLVVVASYLFTRRDLT